MAAEHWASTAIITGTTSGLGLALLEQLHGKVPTIHCLNRRRDADLESRFPQASFHVLDITSETEVGSLLGPILKARQGKLLVILNAAINLPDNDPVFRNEIFREVMATNLFGCSALISVLEAHRSFQAKVVCIGSTAVYVPNCRHLSYSISKTALHGLVRGLQRSPTQHRYQLVVLGPAATRMPQANQLRGAKKRIFDLLALSAQEAAAKILRFAGTDKKTLRLSEWSVLFFRVGAILRPLLWGWLD